MKESDIYVMPNPEPIVTTGIFQGNEFWRVRNYDKIAVYPKHMYTESQAIEQFKNSIK